MGFEPTCQPITQLTPKPLLQQCTFGVGPSLFLELSLAGLDDRLLLLEIDAHICIKTRIKGVKFDWRSKYIYICDTIRLEMLAFLSCWKISIFPTLLFASISS